MTDPAIAAPRGDRPSTTAVLLIIFNRPDKAARVLDAIAAYRPERLFVVADGPRPDRPGEAARCAAARAVVERVDWPCSVATDFADVNMGVDPRIVTGIDWVFSQVDEAIILEDDCVPDPSFFRFAHEMLEHHRDDHQIMTISGNNFADGHRRNDFSYHYSMAPLTTGWATWRRAWQHFDGTIAVYPELRDGGWLDDICDTPRQAARWREVFDSVLAGPGYGWDRCWTLSCFTRSALAVIPSINLIANIGYTADATHTTSSTLYSELPAFEMPFPLRHPAFIVRDKQADARTFRLRIEGGGFVERTLHRVARKFGLRWIEERFHARRAARQMG